MRHGKSEEPRAGGISGWRTGTQRNTEKHKEIRRNTEVNRLCGKYGRRWLVLFLTVLLVSVFATGCGDKGTGKKDGLDMDTMTSATEEKEKTDKTSQSDKKNVKIKKKTGKSNFPGDIGEDKVKKTVLAKVPGADVGDIRGFEWELDDGVYKYEGEIHYKGIEYSFEVDGKTGNILEWEIDD